ncbi:MAG: DNA polymerase III subunit beta [Acidobacteria bacterium]|nr:DNA polymerase III subunit beta [Acidobacteriota bacterium]
MEFTIAKSDLVRELNLSQGVVEKRTTIPILSNVLIEAADGRIVLTATDLELGIRCTCPAEIKKPGSGTVPAKRLLDYVRLLPDAEVNVKFGDNHWVNLVCGRSRSRIAGMSRESYPELPEMSDVIAEIPATMLASMISQTIFAISNEESRFTLNGALMVMKPDALILVATDGHRLALVERPVNFGLGTSYRALLPRKAMAEIQKLAGDAGAGANLQFSSTDNHLFCQIGGRLLLSRKLTGNFPDYERVLPREQPNQVVLQKDEFRATIERVAQFSDERSHAVRMKISPGEIKVFSSLSDTGEGEDTLASDYAGPSVEIGFNAVYMLDFLRAAPEEQVAFLFKDGAAAGEMRPYGENVDYKYRYIIMPMRI